MRAQITPLDKCTMNLSGLFTAVLGKNWEKMIDLTSKFGKINDIHVEHNKVSKIYP